MSQLTPLTTGCIGDIISGEKIEYPIVQILGTKKISSAESTDRYRLLISDGKYLNSFSILTPQMNHYVLDGSLPDYTIIRLDQYNTSLVQKVNEEKKIIIIVDLSILHSGSEVGTKIGDPIDFNGSKSKTKTSTSATRKNTVDAPNPFMPLKNNSKEKNEKYSLNTNNTSTFNQQLNYAITNPIISLSPYQNKWVIKARVVGKTPVKTWSNARGEGKLFSIDLLDESGEIKATAFRDACDKFYDLIQIDKVYYISKCLLKPADKRYTSIKNDYEMTFTDDTVIQLCEDEDSAVPEVQYNFVPISQVANMEQNSIIDVIGICKNCNDIQNIVSKTTNKEYQKRDVTIVDSTNASVVLTFWGEDAINFDGSNNPVISVRGARVTEFGGGKNLSVGSGGTVKINADSPNAHKLRGWFDNGGSENNFSNISARAGQSGGTALTEWMSFYEARTRNLGTGDKPDYFQTKAVIHLIRGTNAVYRACPQTDCNKKVIDEGNGNYRCEKCNALFPTFKYRLLVTMSIGDWTSNRWVTCFSEVAEQIFGKTSQEVGRQLEEDPDNATELFSSVNLQSFIFKLRTKIETYGDVNRNKITIVSASPINYKEYNAYLIKDLQELIGIGKYN